MRLGRFSLRTPSRVSFSECVANEMKNYSNNLYLPIRLPKKLTFDVEVNDRGKEDV